MTQSLKTMPLMTAHDLIRAVDAIESDLDSMTEPPTNVYSELVEFIKLVRSHVQICPDFIGRMGYCLHLLRRLDAIEAALTNFMKGVNFMKGKDMSFPL